MHMLISVLRIVIRLNGDPERVALHVDISLAEATLKESPHTSISASPRRP